MRTDNLTIYEPHVPLVTTIFYFHGGGLIFGSRDDLEASTRDFFLNQGYRIIALDYPLLPETSVLDIISYLQTLIHDCIQNLKLDTYSFFGRSAGSYLAFKLTESFEPQVIVSFYGYALLEKTWAKEANKYFSSLPKLNDEAIEKMIKDDNVLYQASIASRYALYVDARQKGTWLDMIDTHSEINPDRLPPLFLWHSLFDPDVAYRESKLLSQFNSDSILVTSFMKRHDLDIDGIKEIESKLTLFLNKYCGK